MTVTLIVAVDDAAGIGRDGGIPWRLPGELRRTAAITRAAPGPDSSPPPVKLSRVHLVARDRGRCRHHRRDPRLLRGI